MSRKPAIDVVEENRREVSRLLAGNMTSSTATRLWPRVAPLPVRTTGRPRSARQEIAVKVLVVGELAFELPIEVQATRAELLTSLGANGLAKTVRWKMLRLRVGGFVGHAVRVAATLGAQVSVCTVVPVPMPARFEGFFERYVTGGRFLSGLPAPAPITILFRCTDGLVPLRRRSIVSAVGLDLPPASKEEFDVILADPCPVAHRGALIRRISRCLDRATKGSIAGLQVNRQWDSPDLAVSQSDQVWIFARGYEARRMAERGSTGSLNEQAVAKLLHDKYRMTRLVLQLGSRGAILMNGNPAPYHVHTAPVQNGTFASPGATLLTVTTLSSASGVDDRTSLRRGVAAATGQVAGLNLPVCLEELDAE